MILPYSGGDHLFHRAHIGLDSEAELELFAHTKLHPAPRNDSSQDGLCLHCRVQELRPCSALAK